MGLLQYAEKSQGANGFASDIAWVVLQFLICIMNRRISKLIVFVLLVTVSCEKAFMKKDPANDPVTNFDLLWGTLDKQYAYFTYKHIDWSSVYQIYRPLVHDEMSQKELFKVMSDMLYLLKDGHTNLTSPFDRSRNWEWYLNSPSNFNFDILQRNYLGNNYRITGPFLNTVIDSVGYIYYGSFGNEVKESDMDFILQEFSNVKGMIIDVRNNTGGETENIARIASRFTNQKVITQYWLYKSGPEHDQFYHPEAKYLDPAGSIRFTENIVVLTNRRCYSATNDFVATMKALPNVTVIGDTTGGGGGLPFNSELPNGWQFRFSSTMTLDAAGVNIESGISPHIQLNMTPEQELTGSDTILGYAIKFLKNK